MSKFTKTGRQSSFNKYRGFSQYEEAGSPVETLALGEFLHSCEGEMVCKAIIDKVPYFNAPVFLENKTQIGKVDEILGPINEYFFTIKPTEGILATSFKPSQKIFIGSDKLLPLERFLPKPKLPASISGTKRKAPSGSKENFRGKGPRGNLRRGGGQRGGSFRGGRGTRGSPSTTFRGNRGRF